MAYNKDRVLVVDNFPTMRRIITNNLRWFGFRDIEQADDGATACGTFNRTRSKASSQTGTCRIDRH